MFQLPVEHGRTAKYRELSDGVLKLLRDELSNTVLIIIDEVSMISNVTLMYIHLRLTEIFNTGECENGWLGQKHILLFGDLLQLPPVHEGPPFVKVSKVKVEKLIGAFGAVDLWSTLFTYDELTINMRQKGDMSYRDMLSRIRIGVIDPSDTKILETRKIPFTATSVENRMRELCDYMIKLPPNIVCLLPTCAQCDALNTAMLSRIPSDEIKLVAHDIIDCVPYLRKKVSKMLCTDEEDSSRTAGLAKVITIKVGAQIMIRRNIDVPLGLVNGAIATIVSYAQDGDTNDVKTIQIVLSSKVEYTLERANVKFELMDRAFVVRKQFPICLSYGITIHKSQGLSLENALVEAGNSTFCTGQTYVAFSRVTSLQGLHIINYDPAAVKANDPAIIEYNRLRSIFRPDLMTIETAKKRIAKVHDANWAVNKAILDFQEKTDSDQTKNNIESFAFDIRGLPNKDGVSCYANSSMQCFIHCSLIKNAIILGCKTIDAVRLFIESYPSNNNASDTLQVRAFVNELYTEKVQQNVCQFIDDLCGKLACIRSVIEYQNTRNIRCSTCDFRSTKIDLKNIVSLTLPPKLSKTKKKKILNLQEVFDYNYGFQWRAMDCSCPKCNVKSLLETNNIELTKNILIMQLSIFQIIQDLNVKINFDIKAIPTTTLGINNLNYKVKSAIFHQGESFNDGHYVTMLRGNGNSWILIDDLIIEKQRWPRNAKDAFVLLLEQI